MNQDNEFERRVAVITGDTAESAQE